jgi:hypothetical protein
MMMHEGMAQSCGECPMKLPGTTVQAVELEGAAALDFTTTGDVAELRRRVAHMAEMHAQHQTGSGMACTMNHEGATDHAAHEDMKGDEHMMGHGMMQPMPAADVRSEELPQGARLIFTPKDSGDLAALREHVRQHSEHAAHGECPMMAMHQGHDNASPPAGK